MTNDYGNLELHKVLLSAMKDIDKICRENGLRYYLYAGTLLGAVNYQGFIPWDDDIDLVMFPEDFARFEEIIRSTYADRYDLATFDTEADWYSKMNKLYVKGTKVITQHGEDTYPIFIDISKLHCVPDEPWKRLLQRKQIEFINLILGVKSGAIVPTSLKSKLTLGNLAKIRKSFWGKLLDKAMSRYDDTATEYVGIMCNTLSKNPYTGCTGYDNDLTKKLWHDHTREILFEDCWFMTFSNVEEDLDHRYGPHWAEPYPEEKRVTKHDVKSYSVDAAVMQRILGENA